MTSFYRAQKAGQKGYSRTRFIIQLLGNLAATESFTLLYPSLSNLKTPSSAITYP